MTADSHPANRLAAETSPYLQQHARNPVDWYPWSDEALSRARAENRPILLSVGYSACHWCHVMERESFENPATAAVMNEHYVNIKVDREERPDVDEIYMAAVQAMTGSGGWPMTVFLTPDLRPFYGGTYFPPDDRQGRPGFPRVLQAVAEHFHSQRGRVDEQADKLHAFLRQNADPLTRGDLHGQDLVALAAAELVRSHDSAHGGFSPNGPKFPNSGGLSLLLRHWHTTGDAAALAVATHTLTHMANGGIYDHLGGGFHRYSVDERWLAPHFEKMLYDNALLVPVYIDAFQATGTELFGRVARESLDYVLREMMAPDGGYCATQDADSEGEEGRFFVWTPEQVDAALEDEEQARLFCRYYDVTPEGNFEHGQSILHVGDEAPVLARFLDVDEETLQDAVGTGRRALFAARAQRVAPDRDDKVLVSWNGLMIHAMARGYAVFGELGYLHSATAAASFLVDTVVVDGQLRHVYKDGRASIPAFQDDYAALVIGLVSLYEATFDSRWLAAARRFADAMVERFWDHDGDGGFYFVEAGRDDLLVRTKNPFDGATPAGNSLAAIGLLRLAALTGDAALRRRAEDTLALYAPILEQSPSACPFMAGALHMLRHGALEVTVIGSPPARQPYLDAVAARYLPNLALSGSEAPVDPGDAQLLPLLRDRPAGAGAAARAYVCRDSVCSAPVEDVDAFIQLLAPAT